MRRVKWSQAKSKAGDNYKVPRYFEYPLRHGVKHRSNLKRKQLRSHLNNLGCSPVKSLDESCVGESQ